MTAAKISRRGFTAVELAAAVAVTAALCIFVLLTGANQRRLARLGEDLAHLKELGAATGQYAQDAADRFWGFSWVRGQAPVDPNDPNAVGLTFAFSDMQAAANQAVYIMRRRGNMPQVPAIISWTPHPLYTHLVIEDYLEKSLPWRAVISSADRWRLKWAADRDCFLATCNSCQPVGSEATNRRWIFSSSYQPGVAFFDLSPRGSRISQQGVNYNLYTFGPTALFGGCQMSAVLFPSQKVLLADQNARHFGARQPYCTHDEARLPLLMADGSVPVRSAADANPGWDPNSTSPTSVTHFTYLPNNACWDPPALNPSAGDQVLGRFRYTRNGVAGRDFGGPQTP
jgi:hypothetical protein